MMAPQLPPAETLQPVDTDPAPRISLRFAIGLALLVATVIAHHSVWSARL
ncbi:hypothetical protein [Sphingopyxis indica]|uniref:Uncharacterized protein n=1 Tax=Sphingopyxis indica TaxID=436663 RepID=A0A239KQ59_9SPHN|nr:hypothetical protein [Sphingopyxis indica]SNT20150.1 hypothetical protein SAMN06295955_11596 [Sphingopyxis indica]